MDQTFATNPDTPAAGFSLYRFSAGHGGLKCEACHGSTHAEFPSSHVNDNLTTLQIQGHIGKLVECTSCHGNQTLSLNGGPHGMHTVGQSWAVGHPDYVEQGGSDQCRACHGADYLGTVLSFAQGDRTISTTFGSKSFWRGYQIGCYTCHNGPNREQANPNRPPVATNGAASTTIGQSVNITLHATDPEGASLTYRIVSQPKNGTAGLSGSTATYFPFSGFTGADSFTFAAWDGQLNSNLATVAMSVGQVTPPVVSSVIKASGNTFKLKVNGSNFQAGLTVTIGADTAPWTNVTYKGPTHLVLGTGSTLKAKFPKGTAVTIKLVNPDGGAAQTTYTR
jgi:hypothetical protein